MARSGTTKAPPKKTADRPKGQSTGKTKTRPTLRADDDDEDGDIATPKRDRYGTDDEPL